MDTGFTNGLLLLFTVIVLTWHWYTKNGKQKTQASLPTTGAVSAAYRRKGKYRLLVLVCCGLGLCGYVFGLPRVVPLLFAGGAGVCQYLVWQERTGRFFLPPAPEPGELPKERQEGI